MRAAVYDRYGPPSVVHIEDVEKPVPGDNDVLIRVHATTVCAADWRLRKADPFLSRLFNGLWRPKRVRILGMEFSGTVESVGQKVTRFGPGDQVFGGTSLQFGAHAEYVCLPENAAVAIKPANMTLEEAAAVFFGGETAWSYLKKASIRAGQSVLVYGASGSVGIFAVQLAKHFGAHVTAVCSTANLDLMRSLGADEVVDYTREDFAKGGRVYDVIFDAVGKSGFWRSLRSLKRGGCYVLVAGLGRDWFLANMLGGLLGGIWASATGAGKVIQFRRPGGMEELLSLKGLIEAGKLRAVIDRRYSLNEIGEAHRYVEGGHKKGHVIIVP